LVNGLGPDSVKPRIPFLKCSASEIYYPNVFKMPGGKVDSEDATIRDALSREVREETTLELTRMVAQLPEMAYSTERMDRQGNRFEKLIKKLTIQLNSALKLEGTMFK